MLLFVGLGNPGPKYENNRHNIGFMALDRIAEANGFGAWRDRFGALCAEGRLGHEKVLAVKPVDFMNNSGRAVGAAVNFHKIEPQTVLVIHDELDLLLGRLRLKYGGGHAGHNGLRDIHAAIGADYTRLRLGIGRPCTKDRILGHVLSDFSKAERPLAGGVVDAVGALAPMLADDALHDAFLSKMNSRVAPLRPVEEDGQGENQQSTGAAAENGTNSAGSGTKLGEGAPDGV